MPSCGVCVSVCLSVTFVSFIKTNKDIFEIFSQLGRQAILVFPRQTGGDIPTGTPPNWGVECRWFRQKCDSERISLHTLHTGLQCCKPYESRSVKNKAMTDGVESSTHGGVRQRPSFVVRTRQRRSVCEGLDVIRRRRRSNPFRHNPVGHNSVFCCHRTL